MNYDNRGMETLQLGWAARIGGQTIPQSVSFRRVRYSNWDFRPGP